MAHEVRQRVAAANVRLEKVSSHFAAASVDSLVAVPMMYFLGRLTRTRESVAPVL